MKLNKLKLAAMAMSALVAAGTMSWVAFAEEPADQTGLDGIELQADSPAYQVDKSSILFHYNEPGYADFTVTYTEVAQDGSEKTYPETATAVTLKQTEADCETPAYLWMTVTIDGNVYNSGDTNDPTTAFVTGKALGHNWIEKDRFVDEFPNCEKEGKGHIVQSCSRCGKVNTETIPWRLEAEGHDFGENQTRYENLVNLDDKLQLIDITKDGTYDLVTYHVCQRYDRRNNKVCEEEEIVSRENKVVYAKKVVSAVITDQKGIADDLVDLTMGDFRSAYPTDTDIELTNCTKDGQYQVTYYNADKKPVSQKWFTVAAHHMVTPAAVEFDTIEEENQCSVVYKADGSYTVKNKSCYKEITYYEVIHCEAAGCPNKKCVKDNKGEHYTCNNQELKEVSRAAKTAKPEGAHIINTDVERQVKAEAAKTYADYAFLQKLAEDKGSYIKLSANTATCEEDGTATVTFLCKVCKAEVKTITVKTEKLGHNPAQAVGENVVAPTCQEMGSYDAVIYCSRCGKELFRREGVRIPRVKHSNEVSVETNGVGVDDTDTDTGAYFKFYGDKVVDPYDGSYMRERRNKEFDNYIGYGWERREFGVYAAVATNCKYCHDHEVILDKNVVITIVTIEKQKEDGEAGSITLKATYTKNDGTKISEEYTVPYFTTMNSYNGRTVKAPTNGLNKDDDGTYRYYVDGEVALDYTGIVKYNGGEFLIVNGVLASDANGLNQNPENGKWYFLSQGQVQRGFNGLALYDGEWFYLNNGELNKTVNGLVPYGGGTFLFAEGRLVREANGLWQDFDGSWYYLALGQVQTQYTGVAQYDGAFFYVIAGKLASDFNGTVDYDGAKFRVVAGQLYNEVA